MDKLQKEFEEWLESEFGMWAIQARPGVYGSEQIQDMWKAWQAALSANGGEAVGEIVSLDGDNYISTKDDTLRELLPGTKLYTHPTPPSVAVPEDVLAERRTLVDLLRDASANEGDCDTCYNEPNKSPRLAAALAWVASWLESVAPSPDHSGEADKMVDVECCCGETEDAWRLCPSHGPNHIADAGKVVPSDWEGWACHKSGKMPRLYGEKSIAEVNCDTENGERLIFLSAAPSVPEEKELQKAIADDLECWLSQVRHMEGLSAHDIIESAEDYIAMIRTAGDEGEGV